LEGLNPSLAQQAHGIKIRCGRQIMTLRGASRHAQLAARQPLFANFINISAAGRSFEWSGNLFIQAGNLWRSYSGRGYVGCGRVGRGYLRRVCQGTAKLGIPVGHPKRGIHRF
jgi:hypothetical protein